MFSAMSKPKVYFFVFKHWLKKHEFNLTFAVSLIAVVISGLSYVHSSNVYEQTLPLSSANLVFSEESVEIKYQGQDTAATTSDDKVIYTAKLRNEGSSEARNVHFELYVMYDNQSLSFRNTKTRLFKYFDDKLLTPLQPDSTATFGSLILDRFYGDGENAIDLFTEKEKVILIYSLTYVDSLTDKEKTNCYVYKTTLSGTNLGTLISNDASLLYGAVAEYEKFYDEEVCGGEVNAEGGN